MPLLDELRHGWPVVVIIAVIAVVAEISRRYDLKRHLREEELVKEAYARGREDALQEMG